MIILALSLMLLQSDWPSVMATASKAIPRLQAQAEDEAQPGVCAAVVINAKIGYALTAAHCTEGKNVALTLATKAPVMGQEIAVIGYAFGSKQLGSQIGHVSTALDDNQVMRVGVDVIAGDSGGACLNAAGELVGITVAVQHWGPMHLGIVVPLQALKDFIDPYLPKQETK